MFWYRVELNAEGKVVSCRQVDRAGSDGAAVVYVRASDQQSAWQQAANEHARKLLAARRKDHEAAGRCRCGRPRDCKLRRCVECRKKQRVYEGRRVEARKRGEEVPKLDRRQALRERRDNETREERLAVLLEVLQHWTGCKTDGEFRSWLAVEIDKLRKFKGAA